MEGKIYKAINDAMKECAAVGKDSQNSQQGYRYRGIDAVMNALNPAMKKAGIFVAPEVLEMNREERHNAKGTLLIYSTVKVKYTFYANDGSFVCATVMGEGMDSGDKSMNKAMSAAFKYALFQVFCIPTEEMVDSETDSPQPIPKKDEKMELAELRLKIAGYCKKHGEEFERQLLEQNHLNSIAELSDAQVRFLVDKLSI